MCRSAATRLLGVRVRIASRARMSVCCECYVLSGRGLSNGLITRAVKSYRVCLWFWSPDKEVTLAHWGEGGLLSSHGVKNTWQWPIPTETCKTISHTHTHTHTHIYIYVCVCVCVCVYIYICIYIHTYTGQYTMHFSWSPILCTSFPRTIRYFLLPVTHPRGCGMWLPGYIPPPQKK